jgi:NAD(P)-dependent dehydrogenase (short-subunit alcohol dehydrogenase family)
MTNTVLVTEADRGLGFAISAGLLEQGWTVFAGQYMPDWPELSGLAARFPGSLHILPLDVASDLSVQSAAQSASKITDHIDLLINNAGVSSPVMDRSIREPQDYSDLHRLYEINALGPLRVLQNFLPFTDRGLLKRLCFVSSEAGSISRGERKSWYGYCMSKTALNMAVKITFNQLRPQGYTFRLYHPGWVRSYMSGEKNLAADLEPDEAAAKAIPFFIGDRPDEDHPVLVDYQGQEWPW